ncbi:MAG: biotin--[acetyl-CoA-carboxylase] ligase [Anaerolineae bacterium]|nr:biotin--[acetyl-CoA-carboxylase] ligase [Thermoflexales bacterium]MDW8407545.1 biotin--[acetyl-CoA-carboxylase] ligase [Anaerolineae bacterium]
MQFQITRYTRVTSTMDAARALAEAGAPEGTAVLADEQTAGRGRSGHAWYSPPGQSIYLSIVLRPPLVPEQAGWITMSAALAVVDTLAEFTAPASCAVTIKWFNDVQLNGRKVCGILVESSVSHARFDYAVLGIGFNVNTTFDAAPPDVRARATSLLLELGVALDREQALDCLLRHVAKRYAALVQSRRSPAQEYARYVETLGKRVEIESGSQLVRGTANRVAEDGSLIVTTEHGQIVVRAGQLIRQS